MFYSVQLLGKTSPLGKLWLAAHADKRLKRQDINSTDVPQSVGIIQNAALSAAKVELLCCGIFGHAAASSCKDPGVCRAYYPI